ncbi:hypothetical protein GJ496_001595 [Pomphorhynchus laevis]|nr:hypothetical protein GJ496_001595 [Pomphorhynchus laevis]
MQSIDKTALYGMMLDYSDFNIQHTLDIQSHVFAMMGKWAKYCSLPIDYKAANWCSLEILNSYYTDSKEQVRLKHESRKQLDILRATNTVRSIPEEQTQSWADVANQSLPRMARV